MTAKEKTPNNFKKYIPFLLSISTALIVLTAIIIFQYMRSCSTVSADPVSPFVSDLKVCHLINPLGLDESAPTFSWQMNSTRRGTMQSAYRITVAMSQEALTDGDFCWDSGKVIDDKSVGIPYQGEPLLPKSRYYWQVSVWDETDTLITGVENAWFETGLMQEGMKNAKWISAPIKSSPVADTENTAYSPTTYTITYELTVSDTSAGFVFGATEGQYGDFYICEISHEFEQSLLRIHEMTNGAYTSTQETDITAHLTDGSSKFAVSLSVQKDLLTVNINDTEIGSFPINETPIGSIGCYKRRSNSSALLDNITVTDAAGNVLYSENFESEATIFSPYYTNITEGQLRVSSGFLLTPGYEAPAPLFRREFTVQDKPVKSARLYMTALGSFSASVNGTAVSDDYFSPGKLAFNQQLSYMTYDITPLLSQGSTNVLGLTLLHGWYDRAVGYPEILNPWGDTNALLGKLEICYEDGSSEVIVTDESFLCCTDGPVRSDDIYQGEFYDANYEKTGFDAIGFMVDDNWLPAETSAVDSGYLSLPLVAKKNEPIVCIKELSPVSVSEPKEGVFVYDFGQNIVGTCRIRLTGEQGQVVTLRYAEALNTEQLANRDDAVGTIWTQNLLTAKATDYYVLKGDEQGESFEPRYTFHGFRYLQITGIDDALPPEDVQALVLSSNLTGTGSFTSSNELLNKFYENTVRSQQGNFLDNPTDCPQRDERHGWTGDAQIFSLTASYHANTYAFYEKFLDEMRLLQAQGGSFPDMAPRNFGTNPDGTGGAMSNNCWGDAPVVITWNLYQQYGDITIVEENYEALCKWVDMLVNTSDDFIRNSNGYGDHLALATTPPELSDTAWCAHSAHLVSKMASALGKTQDAAYYASVYESFKEAWQEAFVLEDGSIECYTQTAYCLGLAFDLFPEGLKEGATACLINNLEFNAYHMHAGFSGIGYLLPALSQSGQIDAAYRLLLQEESPSLLYQVKNGATTTWEFWNAYQENEDGTYTLSGSLNHYAFGAPASFLYTDVLGIRSDENAPGYKHILLEPHPTASLSHASGSYDSTYGKIGVSWSQTENGFEYFFEIPANTTATLALPALTGSQVYVESGKNISDAEGVVLTGTSNNKIIYELSSGNYHFTISPL